MPNEALALVLDIDGYRYLDSAAIEVLFDVSRRLGRRRQELRLVVPESPLGRVSSSPRCTAPRPSTQSLEEALTE